MFEEQIPIVADCIVSNLRTDECRAGCPNCYMTELVKELELAHIKINHENGMSSTYKFFIQKLHIFLHTKGIQNTMTNQWT